MLLNVLISYPQVLISCSPCQSMKRQRSRRRLQMKCQIGLKITKFRLNGGKWRSNVKTLSSAKYIS